jgi:hypothetical protein
MMAEVLGDPVPAECLLDMTLNRPATGPAPAPE